MSLSKAELVNLYHIAATSAETLRAAAIKADRKRRAREFKSIEVWLENVALTEWELVGSIGSEGSEMLFKTLSGNTMSVRPTYEKTFSDEKVPTSISFSYAGTVEIGESSEELDAMEQRMVFAKQLQCNLVTFEATIEEIFENREGIYDELREADSTVAKLERLIHNMSYDECLEELYEKNVLMSTETNRKLEVVNLSKSKKTAEEIHVYDADGSFNPKKGGSRNMSNVMWIVDVIARERTNAAVSNK